MAEKNDLEKNRRAGQAAGTGAPVNEPHRGDQSKPKKDIPAEDSPAITPDHNRPEDATTQNPRKINPGTGFTVDPTINPDQGATKQW